MKKIKTLKLALMPFSVMSILTGCGTDKVRLPEVKSFEYYDCVDYYGWNSETQAVEIFAEGDEGSYVNLFNGEIITFEDVEFYVADTMNYLADNSDAVRFSTEKNVENKTVIITNETTKATLTLNYKKQKITYSDYSAFLNYSIEALCPSDVISRELKNDRFIDTKLVKSKSGKSITIDLNKYDIPMYWHEDKCYLPTAFVGNFFYGVSLSLGITTAFDGKDLYLTNYQYSDEYKPYFDILNNKLKDKITTKYMEFGYNMAAVILDYTYGFKKRFLRTENKYKNYLPKGAYDILKPYKKDLISMDPNAAEMAWHKFVATEIDDGGHTASYAYTIFKNQSNLYINGKERAHTGDTIDYLMEERLKHENIDIEENAYSEIDNVSFITIDAFDMDFSSFSNPEEEAEETPYYSSTYSLITYANEIIKEHQIKDVVIDLSCNGGGILVTSSFVESWLTGGTAHLNEICSIDGAAEMIETHADINGDGIFDENDYLPEDVNVYCIVSDGTFSAANTLAVNLRDYSNTKFIGSRSAGGCCSVKSYVDLGNGLGFGRMSSQYTSFLKTTDLNNVQTTDDGVVADFYKIECTKENASRFYDREEIVKIIKGQNK